MATLYSPRIVTDGLVLCLDPANYKSLEHPIRDYEYGVWADGQTGRVGIFEGYSSRNRRVVGIDPFGNDAIVWESYSVSGSTAGGGIYITDQPIDHTKTYRVSIWEKRITNEDATFGRYYLGCNGYGTVNGVRSLNAGSISTNPYFWNSGNGFNNVPSEWTLMVGHILPSDTPTSGNSIHPDSGRWLQDGTFVGSITTDWVLLPETTTFRLRTLAIYLPDATTEMIHHSIYPRIDLIDGTEPTLNDLITNNVERLKDISSNNNDAFRVNGPIYNSDNGGSIIFNGVNDYITIPNLLASESIGVTTQLTISIWLNCDVYSDKMPFSTGQTGNDRIYYWSQNSLNTWRVGDYTSTTGHSTLPSVGTWFNTVLVINGTNITVYLNGIEDYTGSYTPFTTADYATLGRHGNTSLYYFDGKIANTQIYNRALASTEVLQNYNALKRRFGL